MNDGGGRITAPLTMGLLKNTGLIKVTIKVIVVLSVEVSCLCRLLIYTDNDFHLNLGFK